MKNIFKFFGLIIFLILFFSVTVNDRPIFSYLYDAISPATKFAQNATQDFFSKSFSSTQSFSKKLFENSVPKVKDTVKSKYSASRQAAGQPAEKITDEEKEQLDQLIKNH